MNISLQSFAKNLKGGASTKMWRYFPREDDLKKSRLMPKKNLMSSSEEAQLFVIEESSSPAEEPASDHVVTINITILTQFKMLFRNLKP